MTTTEEPYLDRVYAASSTEESRRLYDEWAATYDSDMLQHDFTAPRLVAEHLFNVLKQDHPNQEPKRVLKDLRIVDAGCGTGTVGNELAKLGAKNIDGLDNSEGMLQVARKTGAYSALKIADLTKKLEFSDAEYDALTCCGTLTRGHLGPEPLAEFVRIVKSGGVVIATVLDGHWMEKGFENELRRLEDAGSCAIVENKVLRYLKGAVEGRILILRVI